MKTLRWWPIWIACVVLPGCGDSIMLPEQERGAYYVSHIQFLNGPDYDIPGMYQAARNIGHILSRVVVSQ